MIKNRVLYLAVLASALLFYVFYFGWASQFAFYFALLTPLFSFLVSLPSMLLCRLHIQSPHYGVRGQEANTAVVCIPSRIFPCGHVKCRVILTNRSLATVTTERVHICNYQKQTLSLSTEHCGSVEISVLHSRVYDYLGLIWLPLRKPLPVQITILPNAEIPKPAPRLSEIEFCSYRPKRGGGYAEVHEIREFHDGDSLRDVHWKLTAKTDQLMLREAMEPDRDLVLLSFSLSESAEACDHVFGRLTWIALQLLSAEVPFSIRYYDAELGSPCTIYIDSVEALQLFYSVVFQQPFSQLQGTVRCEDAGWHYHVRPETEVEK